MNEQELKQMIEGILTEMSGGKTTDTVANLCQLNL